MRMLWYEYRTNWNDLPLVLSSTFHPKLRPHVQIRTRSRQAVAVSPDNVPLLLLLAHACLDEWSLDEALGHLRARVQSIDPNRPDARGSALPALLHLSGKTSEAAVVRTRRSSPFTRTLPRRICSWRACGHLPKRREISTPPAAAYERALAPGSHRQGPRHLEKELLTDPVPKPPRAGKGPRVTGPSWSPEADDEDKSAGGAADVERPNPELRRHRRDGSRSRKRSG